MNPIHNNPAMLVHVRFAAFSKHPYFIRVLPYNWNVNLIDCNIFQDSRLLIELCACVCACLRHFFEKFRAVYLTQFLTDFNQILDSKSYDQEKQTLWYHSTPRP